MFTPFSEDNIQIDQQDMVSDQQINQQLDKEDALRKQQEQQATAKAATEEKKIKDSTDPKTGRPKSTHETLDPKQFGLAENAQEAVNAVGGGVVDAANSVLALPKFLDPNFYKAGEEYKPPFLQIEKPITRTVWGNVTRSVTEFVALSAATRGAAKGAGGAISKLGPVGANAANPLNYLASNKTTVAGRLGQSAAAGAVADVVSNQSSQNNAAAELIKLKPEWASVLTPIATNDSMSPAQRALYNIGEGLGLGLVIDTALEGAGAGLRAVNKNKPKPGGGDPEIAKMAADRTRQELDKLQEAAYVKRTELLDVEARRSFEVSIHRSAKAKLETDETFSQWRKRVNDEGSSPWLKLDDAKKQELMLAEAKKRDMDWGPNRNYEARAKRQADQTTDVGLDRLTRDEATPDDAFVYDGGTPERGQAISAELDPMAALRDLNSVRNDFTQAEGTPRSMMTEAQIRRIEVGAPGMSLEEIDRLTDLYQADPGFKQMFGAAKRSEIKDRLTEAQMNVNEFLEESGNFRGTPVTDEAITDYLGRFGFTDGGKKIGGNLVEGVETYNAAQLIASDVLTGTLLRQVRDIARAAQSVAGEVDILDKDSLGDLLFSRITTLARMRKETSMLNSYSLRMMSAGKAKTPANDIDFMTSLTDASDEAAATVSVIREALRTDTDDALLRTYIEILATGGDKIGTFKDLDAFIKRKLHGYSDANSVQKSAIVAEMQSMFMHSILSGPKTVVRAFTGTGITTFMRPVATIIGSTGDYIKGNDATMRSAFAQIHAMNQSFGEAWSVAKQRWAGQITSEMPSVKSIADSVDADNIKDLEWEALGNYINTRGTEWDQAAYNTANAMRWVNKFPLANYSTRAMGAVDQFFGHLMGRARVRQLAFNEAYDTIKQAKGVVSDADARELTRLYEAKFEQQVWTADGQLNDTFLKRAQEEATLTEDLPQWGQAIQNVADKVPAAKPFLLFFRTSVNALKLTTKYTPLLNRFLGEVNDIRNLSWDDPKMLTYGIKSPQDHAAMKALTNGRVALGYATIASASTLFMNGAITGNGPSDKQLRDTWIQMGWKPRSIKVGDKYVSYDALEPFNLLLSTVADIGDSSREMGDDWTEQKLGQLAFILGQNVVNKSFLTGIVQLNDLLNIKTLPRVAANIMNNQLPWGGMRNEIGKLLSPGMRELDNGIQDSWRNRNLYTDLFTGPDNKVPHRYDILNGSKINDYDFMTRAFNAVSPFQMNLGSTPTREFFFRSGIDAKQTFNSGPDGEELTPKMKSRYQYLIGKQNLEAQLEREFQNPQMVQSILSMEADRAAGRQYTVDETLHGSRIKSIIDNAKKRAWLELSNTEDAVGTAVRQQAVRQLSTKARRKGDSERANELLQMVNK